ncbi:MAG: hypothetical protein ACJAXB_001625, partial [Candidatus Endobugula sp.]
MSEQKDLNEREDKFFDRMKVKASKIVNDREELRKLLVDVQDKMSKSSADDSLKSKVFEFISLIVRMIKGY